MALSGYLKQSTAATVTIGPFLDETDGKTAETALTLSQADIRLSKNDGAFSQKGETSASSHKENGYYSCSLNTTDIGTLGLLTLAVHESGALPVRHDFLVLPAHVYDGLVAGTDNLQVDTVQVSGTNQTARDIGASVLLSSGTGTGQVKLSSGYVAPNWGDVGNPTTTVGLSGTTVKTATDVETDTQDIQSRLPSALGANGNIKADVRDFNGTAGTFTAGRPEVNTSHAAGTAWNSGAITANTLASNAITSAKIATDAIGSAQMAATAWTEMIAALLAYDHSSDDYNTGQIGLDYQVIADLLTNLTTVLSRLGTPSNLGSGASLAGNMVDIENQTDDIGAAGAGLTSLPAVTVGAINAAGVQDLFTVDSGETNSSAVDGSLVAETAKKVWNSSTSGWFFGTMGELFGTFSTTLINVAARIGNWTGSGRNTILGAFQALFRSDADATVPSDVNADLGAGAGDAANTTESLEALRDRGDAAWTTATGFSTLTQADVRTAVGLTSANLDSQLGDIPTNAELTAALAGADDAVLAAIAALNNLSAAQVWDLANAIETGETPRQVLRLLRAVIAGVSAADDPEAGTVVFKRKDGTTTALTVVYNATADRTTVTVGDLS